jgi:Carboxypeptidase regulatory-like domain
VVTVAAGQTTSAVSATLLPDGGISGTVTGPAPATAPLRGICVQAFPLNSGLPPLLAATAADGSYQLTGLIPGRYRVEFTADCGTTGYATQWWHDAKSSRGASAVVAVSGTTKTGIDATMKH